MLPLNQRVRISESRFAFGGVTGVVTDPPAFVAELDPDPWDGHHQLKPRKDEMVLLYWVEFDVPTDDGSGDGPYSAAAIEDQYLEPVVGQA